MELFADHAQIEEDFAMEFLVQEVLGLDGRFAIATTDFSFGDGVDIAEGVPFEGRIGGGAVYDALSRASMEDSVGNGGVDVGCHEVPIAPFEIREFLVLHIFNFIFIFIPTPSSSTPLLLKLHRGELEEILTHLDPGFLLVLVATAEQLVHGAHLLEFGFGFGVDFLEHFDGLVQLMRLVDGTSIHESGSRDRRTLGHDVRTAVLLSQGLECADSFRGDGAFGSSTPPRRSSLDPGNLGQGVDVAERSGEGASGGHQFLSLLERECFEAEHIYVELAYGIRKYLGGVIGIVIGVAGRRTLPILLLLLLLLLFLLLLLCFQSLLRGDLDEATRVVIVALHAAEVFAHGVEGDRNFGDRTHHLRSDPGWQAQEALEDGGVIGDGLEVRRQSLDLLRVLVGAGGGRRHGLLLEFRSETRGLGLGGENRASEKGTQSA
mmetsp:Transcript_31324/g.56849  ORF Transcript_31324/g.56849 Transcript_31324/m.56849 type:complete len:434 (-) Transcript_31324:1153-2454(-)